MKKIIVWGADQRGKMFYSMKGLWKNSIIVGVVDSNKSGYFHGLRVQKPEAICEMDFDTIVICSRYYEEILEYIRNNISGSREIEVRIFDNLVENLRAELISKYKELGGDEWEWVKWFQDNDLSVWGKFVKPHTEHIVNYEEGHPYIIFENKRVYYPDDYSFNEKNGDKYVYNFLSEQAQGSPHLYVRYPADVCGCIVDAGVCEGNFSIRFVDQARKIYLIENDPRWIEALQRTFFPYKEKTVICEKRLGRYTASDMTCLDDLVTEKIDFLKMDIEGAEVDALLGGWNILQKSRAKCAIAAYHRFKDEKIIKNLLSSMGYSVDTSDGYMFYLYDEDINYTVDIRRGIVYADKMEI